MDHLEVAHSWILCGNIAGQFRQLKARFIIFRRTRPFYDESKWNYNFLKRSQLSRLTSKRNIRQTMLFFPEDWMVRENIVIRFYIKKTQKGWLNWKGAKFRFHDIRHVFASTLLRNGARLDDIRLMLGHEDRSTTDRYTSIDRFDVKNVLTLLPQIRESGKEKSSDSTCAEASWKTDTNHGLPTCFLCQWFL